MRSAEVVCMVSFVVYLVAFVLLIVGFAVPFWRETEDGSTWRGLWRYCTEGTNGDSDDCDTIDIADEQDWFRATIALMACSFIFALVAGLASMFLPVTSGLQVIAGLFAIVAVAIYASEVEELEDDTDVEYNLMWGFGLACAGGALFVINGLLVACYAGYLGCYVDAVAPCCRDFRAPWSKKRRYYDEDYGYDRRGPPPQQQQYMTGGRPSVAYMTQPRPSVYAGRPAPTMASTGYGTAYQPQPRASMMYPRGSAYPY